jgi:hypothetical protein
MRILDVELMSAAEADRLAPYLTAGEEVDAAFASATGAVVLTGRRILIVTREHLLEEKVETTSWPYRQIHRFSIQESADGRASLRIWLGDEAQPLHLRASAGVDLYPLQRLLAERLG